jgi:hypothetical protein
MKNECKMARASVDEGLVTRKEGHVPVAADDIGEPHQNGCQHARIADAADVGFTGIERFDEYPYRSDDSEDPKTLGEASRAFHCASDVSLRFFTAA